MRIEYIRISDLILRDSKCLRFQQVRRQTHEAVNQKFFGRLCITISRGETLRQNLGHSRLVEELVVSVKLVVVLAEQRKPIRNDKTGTARRGNGLGKHGESHHR